MDGTDGLVLWILGGAGITLLYSAFKGKSPLSVLSGHLSNAGTISTPDPNPNSVGQSAHDAVNNIAPTAYNSNGAPYSVGMDPNGTQYVYDGQGNPMAVLPANYDNTPSTYIPVMGA